MALGPLGRIFFALLFWKGFLHYTLGGLVNLEGTFWRDCKSISGVAFTDLAHFSDLAHYSDLAHKRFGH